MANKSASATGYVEVNFDGLVGPTHNYAGLSPGNLASVKHADTVSHPRQAALQGLAKMKLMLDLGVPQAILPPHPRPMLDVLGRIGFSDLQHAHRETPRLLAAVYSSSAMWAANAATVSPAPDTADHQLHITPANLLTQFHRSIESAISSYYLKRVIAATHHDPLPATDCFADEGAANHLRLCADHGEAGLQIFVYGRDETSGPTKFPARQTRQACASIARLHALDPNRTMILRQSADAIDAGAFHNDVVVASNQNVLMLHRQAFADPGAIDDIKTRFEQITGKKLWTFNADPGELSLADAVSTYIFNSQLVTLRDGSMSLIAPLESRDHAGVQRYVDRILSASSPVNSVRYVDLRQSMHNGGGPACLRLRVVMPAEQACTVTVNTETIETLEELVRSRYREDLKPADLTDPNLPLESQETIGEILRVLKMSDA